MPTGNLEGKLLGLKNPVQLAGYLASAVLGFLGIALGKTDPVLLIIAGLIGVSIYFFGLSLSSIDKFPEAKRAGLVITIYSIFGGLISLFLILAIIMIIGNWKKEKADVASGLHADLAAEISKAQADIKTAEDDAQKARQDRDAAGVRGLAEKADRLERNAKAKDEQVKVHAERLKKLQGLFDELTLPDSQLAKILREFQAQAGKTGQLMVEARAQIARTADLANIQQELEAQLNQELTQAVQIRANLGWVMSMRGDFKGARENFLKVLQDQPENREVLEGMAELEGEQGNYSEAAFYYDRLIDGYKGKPAAEGKLVYALANRATMARFQNDWEGAGTYVARCETLLTADFADRNLYEALAANDLGFYYLSSGKLGRAKDLFDQSLHFYDDASRPAYGKSDILNNFGAYCSYIEDFGRAEQLLNEAKLIVEKVARGSYGHGVALENLAGVLFQEGKIEPSQRILEEVQRIYTRGEASGVRQTVVKFKLALCKLNATHGPQVVQELEAFVDEMIKTSSTSDYRAVNMRRWISETFRAYGLIEHSLEGLQQIPNDSLGKLPAFIAESYEAEVLLVEAAQDKLGSEELQRRLVALDERLASFGEKFPWIERKIKVAKAFNALHHAENTRAVALFKEVYEGRAMFGYLEKRFLDDYQRYFSPVLSQK